MAAALLPRSAALAPAARPGPVRRRILAAAAAAFYHPPLLFFLFFFPPLLELRARGGGDGAIPGRAGAREGEGEGRPRGTRALSVSGGGRARTRTGQGTLRGTSTSWNAGRTETLGGAQIAGAQGLKTKVGRRGAGRMGNGAARSRGRGAHAHVEAGQGGGGLGHVLQAAGQGEGRGPVWSVLLLVSLPPKPRNKTDA